MTVTITLPSGKTISGVARHIDEFSVSLYDSSGSYHAVPLDGAKVEINDPLAKHAALIPRYTDSDIHNLLAYLETLK